MEHRRPLLLVLLPLTFGTCAATPQNPDIAWADAVGLGLAVWEEADSAIIWSRMVNAAGYAVDPSPVSLSGAVFATGHAPRVASNGVGYFVVYQADHTDPCGTGASGDWIAAHWYENGAPVFDYRSVCPGWRMSPEPFVIAGVDAEQPAVAYDPVADVFLVVWIQKTGSYRKVMAQAFTSGASIVPVGVAHWINEEFNLADSYSARHPAVAGGPGHFAITWTNPEGSTVPETTQCIPGNGYPCVEDLECLPCANDPTCQPNEFRCYDFSAVWSRGFIALGSQIGPMGIPHTVSSGDGIYTFSSVSYGPTNGSLQWTVAYDFIGNHTTASYDVFASCLSETTDPGGGFLLEPVSGPRMVANDSINERRPVVVADAVNGSSSLISWHDGNPGTFDHRARRIQHSECELSGPKIHVSSSSCDEGPARGAFDGKDILFARRDVCDQQPEIVSSEVEWDNSVSPVVDLLSH